MSLSHLVTGSRSTTLQVDLVDRADIMDNVSCLLPPASCLLPPDLCPLTYRAQRWTTVNAVAMPIAIPAKTSLRVCPRSSFSRVWLRV